MKKIGLLALVLVLALGVIGVGYAAWSHTISVAGTVNTGTASAIFTGSQTSENADNFSNNMCYATAVPDANPAYLDVTVYNAFPGVKIEGLPYFIQNNGDVPIAINSLTLTSDPTMVTLAGSTYPTDAIIAPTASSSEGTLTIQLSTDPTKIPEGSSFSFTADIGYGVVVGP
jgi:hypothetical protein